MYEREHYPSEDESRVPMEVVHVDERLIPNKNVTRALKVGAVGSYMSGGAVGGLYVFDEAPKLIRSLTEGVAYNHDFDKAFFSIIAVFIFYLAGSFMDEVAKVRTAKTEYIQKVNTSHPQESKTIHSLNLKK